MDLDRIIDLIYTLPQDSKKRLKDIFSECSFSRGHILLKANKVEKDLYFIKNGIVRAYAALSDSDLTFWFGAEGSVVMSMKSYVEQKAGYENIELLEDSVFYKINSDQLQQLFQADIHIANWGRKLAERELIKTDERLISREFRSAKDRYLELLTVQPDLLRRVQLGYIASYLGITQVSLSRIRAEIR